LFRNFVLFNTLLSHFNAELDQAKKKNIQISVSTPPISYAILDSIVDYERIFQDLPVTENPNYEEIHRQIEVILNIFAKDSEPQYLAMEGLKLGYFSLFCTKCGEHSRYDDSFFINAKFVCQECKNSQKFKKRQLKDLMYYYNNFQESIDVVNKSNLFVIPFSLTGAFISHVNGDNKIFKVINDLK